MSRLLSYHWPGNIRQLESALERAILLADGDVIEESHLPHEVLHPLSGSNPYGGIDLPDTGLNLEELEKHLLTRAMEKSDQVIAKAARLLGLTYRTLQYRLEKYQLPSHAKK
jgi:transcriptional regulator with PAS, ATPase and Fis domain